MKTRLNKHLALCGLGSRRKVEDLIKAGRITVNGSKITEFAFFIDPEQDQVKFDGKLLKAIDKFHYIILNKPRGYITSLADEKGRATVMELIPEKYKRTGVFPVGRLDKDTEGLLLFTNDGDLGHQLNHPRYKVIKEYIVEIDRPLDSKDKSKMERGIFIHQIKTKTNPAKIEIINSSKKIVKFSISEGKKRQIRYTFLKFGYKVLKLKRIAYGPLTLQGVNRGSLRVLKAKEVKELKRAANIKPVKKENKK